MNPLAHRAGRLLMLCAALITGGCWNDDDEAPATAQAQADTAVATWNRTLEIDVLANDAASAGALTLAGVVQAPVHGNATVADGRIVYTPNPGYYGSDTLRYSVSADDSGATAEATVTITVEAALTLHGLAVDAPLAAAAVQVSGAASAAATTDAQGRWSAAVRVADPQAVLRIVARGSAAQAHVSLVSSASAAEVVAQADTQDVVTHNRAGALAVSHFSTALAALAAAVHGSEPDTAAALAAAQARVPAGEMVDLATMIHMLADEGLPLPAGVADTWALARDAGARAALLAELKADSTARAGFDAAKGRALAAAVAAGELAAPGVVAIHTTDSFSSGGSMITLAADGSAQVIDRQGSRAATWTRSDGSLVLNYQTPASTTAFSSQADPATGLQWQERYDTVAMRLKLLPGGLVEVATAVTLTPLGGPRAGQVQTLSALNDPGRPLRVVIEPWAAQPLAQADFDVGKRWAGIVVAQPQGQWSQDVLEMTAPGQGRARREGTLYTVEVSGPSFTLSGNDGSRRQYLRLSDAVPGAGAAKWMMFDRGTAEAAQDVMLVAPGQGHTFDASNVARVWRIDFGGATAADDIRLHADGSATYVGQPATWQLLSPDMLHIDRPRTFGTLRAQWVPLSRSGDMLWVLRRLTFTSAPETSGTWTVLGYRDMGPGG